MKTRSKFSTRMIATGALLASLLLTAGAAVAQKEQFQRSKPHANAGKPKEKPKSLYFPETMLQEQTGSRQTRAKKLKAGGESAASRRHHSPVTFKKEDDNATT